MAIPELVQVARKLYQAILSGKDKTETDIKGVLFPAGGSSNPAWGLALVLGALLRRREGDTLSELADTGVSGVAAQLSSYEGSFPPSFQKFLDRAKNATDVGGLAAAGAYFATTTNELGLFVKPSLFPSGKSPPTITTDGECSP